MEVVLEEVGDCKAQPVLVGGDKSIEVGCQDHRLAGTNFNHLDHPGKMCSFNRLRPLTVFILLLRFRCGKINHVHDDQ